MNGSDDAIGRISTLEGQVRKLRIVLAGILLAAMASVLSAWRVGQERVIRAEQIIIEDAQGRDRMIIGRQSDFGGQRQSSIGMEMNDSLGYERFRMGLRPNGDYNGAAYARETSPFMMWTVKKVRDIAPASWRGVR